MNDVCLRLVDDSDPSADICFDMEVRACPHPATFLIPFSRCTHIMPFTYVYVLFVGDLVLVKFVAVGETSSQSLVQFLYWPHITSTRCHLDETESNISSP